MFIKVTGLYTGKTTLVNTDNIYCVVENEGRAEIVYTDDSGQAIKESFDEIERMLKGADDELGKKESHFAWIPCSERLPETDNKHDINEYDVLLLVRAKKHPERTPQVYIGKLLHIDADDGSGNFWGIKTEPCEWTIWGWSYFQEPEVLAWMPLPESYKEGADDEHVITTDRPTQRTGGEV